MDFDLTADEHAFRDEVCAFLTAELTEAVWRTERDPDEQGQWRREFTKAFRRKLGAAGYIGMGWPAAYGGGGKSRVYQTIFAEEMEYHRAPGLDRSITYVPNALLAFGTDAQKAEFLPRIARGELSWFVGYSEPEAGSDLANLKARAVPDGSDFVVTGQKAFSSEAHMAEYCWLAARTGPVSPKHRGISMFIVDMQSPGIRIDRYPTLAGWTHHAVYFDAVRVPDAHLVGEIDRGWSVIMGAIDFERAALAAPGLVAFQLDRLLAHAREQGRLDDPVLGDQLARLATEAEGARLMSYWIASLHAHGEMPQFETSMAVLCKRETARLFDAAGLEMLGAFAPLRAGSPGACFDGDIEAEYRDHLYFQFAAGGFDITRNVIAHRGLGLPR
ncbi:MAG: acyl-CoA dehydrogenase family protein [Candidatus Rokubacteria bacterium]|nr:acyl-CoA dehydrogenase family protein [Candidatus Rokubacteria bacterium]